MAFGEVPKGVTTLKLTLGAKPLPLKADVDDKELLQQFLAFIGLVADRQEKVDANTMVVSLLKGNLNTMKINRRGVLLTQGAASQYVDVDALVKGGSYTRDGAGYTVAGAVADLIRFAATADSGEDFTEKYAGLFRQLAYALEAHLLDSAKVVSKVARGASMDTCRVHTTDTLPMWELHINPNSPLAATPEYQEGETVFAVRTPVNFVMPFKVVHNPNVPLGVVMVDALSWHIANEGDADGDSIAMLPVPEQFAAEAWKRWHASENAYLTGQGYALVRQ